MDEGPNQPRELLCRLDEPWSTSALSCLTPPCSGSKDRYLLLHAHILQEKGLVFNEDLSSLDVVMLPHERIYKDALALPLMRVSPLELSPPHTSRIASGHKRRWPAL